MNKLWLVMAFAIFGSLMSNGASAMPPMAPIPQAEMSVKEGKIHVSSSTIIELYRIRDRREPDCSLDWSARLKNRDKNAGKVDVAKFANELKPRDYAAADEYVEWLRRQEPVGYHPQAIGKFLTFPGGLYAIIRPGLTQLNQVKLMLGSVDGGLTWNVGTTIPGKGWGIPFSAKQLIDGPHEVLVLVVDHSNSRTPKVFLFSLGTRTGLGNQWVSYQFIVRPLVYPNGEEYDVASLSLEELVNHCDGLIGAFTPRPQGTEPHIVQSNGGTARDRDVKSDVDHDREYRRDEKSVDTKNVAPVEAEVRVELEEPDGHILQNGVLATFTTLSADRQELDRKVVVVTGPTTVKMKPGASYPVTVDGDFENIESKTTENGAKYIFRLKPEKRQQMDTDRDFQRNAGEGHEEQPPAKPVELLEYKVVILGEESKKYERYFPASGREDTTWWVDGKAISFRVTGMKLNLDTHEISFTDRFPATSNVSVAFSAETQKYLRFYRKPGEPRTFYVWFKEPTGGRQ